MMFSVSPYVYEHELDECGVYLIHAVIGGKVIHYNGLAKNTIRERLEQHAETICEPPAEPFVDGERVPWSQSGAGARLMGVLNFRHASWTVARTWPQAGHDFEKRLKSWNKSSDYCPECIGERALRRACK